MIRHRLALLVTCGMLVIAAMAPAAAQPRSQRPAPATPAPPPPPEPPPPPYEPLMLRLATLMGALAHLEDLCTGGGTVWRQRMQALLDAEEAGPGRRERLAGAYNESFVAYLDAHHSCTPAARAIIARFRQEGATLTADIANRFGG